MDFFKQQERARRNSFWILILFLLGVVAVVLAVDAVFYAFLSESLRNPKSQEEYNVAVQTLVYATLGTVVIIFLGTIIRSIQLRRYGGRGVAESLGGRLVNPSTDVLQERMYLNIVEEMAIASGVPVPPAYVLDGESSINAFAAGYSPEDAVVAVTRGTLDTLSRDELQGVIGHEFSHILNGDMRTNINLMGITYGILLLYTIGSWIFYIVLHIRSSKSSSSSNSNSATGLVRLGLILLSLWVMFVGLVGVFIANIIKAALSRQREYLADASSVQFTRNPAGIASALKRIGKMDSNAQKIDNANAGEASHLFFTEAVSTFFRSIMASHPPLEKRVKRLDPKFNPKLALELSKLNPVEQSNAFATSNVVALNASVHNQMAEAYQAEEGTLAFMLQNSNKKAGKKPNTAGTLCQTLDSTLGACAYIFALLTDRKDENIATLQHETVANFENGAALRDYERILKQLPKIGGATRLMYLQLAIPTLKQLSITQYRTIRSCIRALIKADSVVDLNEYFIYSMVCRQLDIAFGLRRPSSNNRVMDIDMFQATMVVFSRLAYAGSDDMNEREHAFQQGLDALNVSDALLLPAEKCTNQHLQTALIKLDSLAMEWKLNFLRACDAIIQADCVTTDSEAVLRYGIAATLGIY